MLPFTNSTLSIPSAAAFARASSSISSVMSRPTTVPAGPTLRAEMRTSAPAPEPRSRTVSPSRSSATAVGTPHPIEAATAASGAPSRSRAGVEALTEHGGLVVSQGRGTAAGGGAAAAGLSGGCGDLRRGGGVAGADTVADIVQLSHRDELLQWSGIDVVVGPEASALRVHDAGIAQHLEMVRERGLGHLEQRHELAHADLARVLAEHVHQLQADRISQRLGAGRHLLGPVTIDIGVDHRLAAGLPGTALLLGGQLQIDAHQYRDIN